MNSLSSRKYQGGWKKWRGLFSANKPHTFSAFESLPDEILYDIFEFIYPIKDNISLEYQHEYCFTRYQEPSELLSLVRCSRRLYQIGIPFLYNTFTQHWPTKWPLFLRTLFEHEDLISDIQHFKVTTTHYYLLQISANECFSVDGVQLLYYQIESRTIDDQIKALTLENDKWNATEGKGNELQNVNEIRTKMTAKESLIHARKGTPPTLQTISLPRRLQTKAGGIFIHQQSKQTPSTGLPISHDTEQIVRSLVCDDFRAIVIYLIYRLSQLQSITIEEEKYHPQLDGFQEIFKRAISPPSVIIPYLKKVTVMYAERSGTAQLATYFPLLLQASVRSFTGVKIREFGWTPEPRDLQLPLTHLSLAESNLSSSSLHALLKCCPNLTYLYVQHDQNWAEQPFIPRHFVLSIKHLRETLQSLTLIRSELQYYQPPKQEEEFSLLEDSLKEFKVLKKLDITAHLLLGPQKGKESKWWTFSQRFRCPQYKLADCLPSSIEHLVLRDCCDEIRHEVGLLAQSKGKSNVVPRLKKLALHMLDLPELGEVGEEVKVGQKFGEEDLINGIAIRCWWKVGQEV